MATITSQCPSCGVVADRTVYDIGSGSELSCANCEWCWGAEGQPLQPLQPPRSLEEIIARQDELADAFEEAEPTARPAGVPHRALGAVVRVSAPPSIQVCTQPDHPAKRHGHYGYGGRHWCSDFNSPLLSEENGGHIRGRWILIFEKPADRDGAAYRDDDGRQ